VDDGKRILTGAHMLFLAGLGEATFIEGNSRLIFFRHALTGASGGTRH
jgi:hypothetical protein